MVHLDVLTSLAQYSCEVWADASIGDSKVGSDLFDLVNGGLVHEDGSEFLLTGNHDAVLGANTQAGLSVADGGQRVPDLSELTRGTECG